MKLTRLTIALLAAAAASVVLASALPETILAGDALAYRERMVALFAGQVPYFDFPFEHLPVMIIPLAAAWLLGGFSGLPGYALSLAAVSTTCLIGTGAILTYIEDRLANPGLVVRWLLTTVPLLPFLLFRNDSFVILLTVAGIALALIGKDGWSMLSLMGGILAKAWSAVWAVGEWWRKRRWAALVLLVAFVGAVAITLSPPVQSIQSPQGLHTETFAGSVLGLVRSLRGLDLQTTTTASAYLAAPNWAPGVNLLVGGLVAAWCLPRMRSPFTWPGAWILTGSLLGAGLLAAPYFSTQYVAWLLPFTAWHRRTSLAMLAVSASSLVLISTWHRLFEGTVWWWSLLVGRNLLLLVAILGLSRLAVRPQPEGSRADEVKSLLGDPEE